MKKILLLTILSFTLFSINSFSQETSLSILSIPIELTKNANAVVRDYSVVVIIDAVDKMTVRRKRTVTVLNKIGNNAIDTYTHYDNDTKVTKISAVIYDAMGNKIKKYTKSKFKDYSAVDGGTLYSDSRVLFLEYTPTSYPYTVVFETEYKNTTTGFIPSWYPISDYNVSVEKSSYRLVNHAKIPFRKKEKNFAGYQIEKTSSEYALNYVLKNQPAIKYERRTISSFEFLPILLVALNDFTLKGVKGHVTNWKEFGVWMNSSLLKNRDQLDAATVVKIKNLVKEAKTEVEKAKIVYDYMQQKTRYISVQVGIGGWEPISASEVDKMGYGDCKGLTNYTKALMDAAGVTSYYTIVYAKNKRDIDKDFTSIQGNHIILNIPNNGNDIWLECTSQTIPFGFLGSFTEDRNVLVVTPEGGVIKRTPKYTNEVNYQKITGTIQLDEIGNVKAKIKRVSKGIQYDDKSFIENLTKEEQKKYYISKVWDYNNNFEIEKITVRNNKDAIVFTEELDLSIKSFATVNQDNYLFRINFFNRNNNVPKRYRKRTKPLKIAIGFTDEDEIEITLPKGYRVEALPQEKKIENKFGSYLVSIKQNDDKTIKYIRKFSIKEGVYPKEDYKIYRKFRKAVAKYDNLRIALTKKQ